MKPNVEYEFEGKKLPLELLVWDQDEASAKPVWIVSVHNNYEKPFRSEAYAYRYAKLPREKEYVPFTADTLPKPFYFRAKDKRRTRMLVSDWDDNEVYTQHLCYEYDELLEECEMLDGSPCGLEVDA